MSPSQLPNDATGPSVTKEGTAGRALTLEQLGLMWNELSLLAKSIRQQRNQVGASFRTSDVLMSAMRRLTVDAAKRWAEGEELTWENRERFFAAAATAMHRAIIDHVRARSAIKRYRKRVPLDDGLLMARQDPEQCLALDECLAKLSRVDGELGELARRKIFMPLTNDELGEIFGVSDTTIDRHWQRARAHLADCLGYGGSGEASRGLVVSTLGTSKRSESTSAIRFDGE